MSDFSTWPGHVWNWITWQITHLTLATGLWIGLCLLTLVLLILMRTRWGQVAPIWKCAVLSIFAHILLAIYAYGTHLIFKAPVSAMAEPFALTLVDNDVPIESPDQETTVANPWDELDVAAESGPEAPFAERLVTNLQPDTIPAAPELPHEVTTPSNQFAEVPAITESTPLPDSDDLVDPSANRNRQQPIRSMLEPKQITFARQRSVIDETIPAPGNGELIADRVQQELPQSPPVHANPAQQLIDSGAMQLLLQDLASRSIESAPPTPQLELNRSTAIPHVTESGTGRPDDGSKFGADEEQTDTKSRRLADGREMPEIYSGRGETRRLQKAIEFGGNLETEQAVESALRWLARNQESAGNWNAAKHGAGQEHRVLGHDRQGAGADADTGITGLALLAFLAAGNSHLEGPHREVVQHGLEFLINQQAGDGNLAGNSRLFARMYCHAMATLALAEALAVTGDRRLVEPVRRAIDYSLRSQDRNSGGWRYRPGDQGDMSQFGWQVMALKSASLGGIEIPEEATRLMTVFLQRCTSGSSGGLAGYRPGQQPTPTMTAEALLCRHFIYQDVADATDAEAARYLLQNPPGMGEVNYYYWYYGTLAMFHAGGENWESWNNQMSRTIVSKQVQHGEQAGSWEPNGVWCGYGGRVYSTALATLCLEVYYRYSR